MFFDFSKSVTREEALELLKENWNAKRKTEIISVDDSIGRVSSCEVYAQYDAPVYRTSALDGIAVNSKNFENGIPNTEDWQEGIDFVRADTGDDFPDEYDTIIAIEDITLENGKLKINNDLEFKKGDLVRPAGELAKKGEKLIDANVKITPMIASMLVLGGVRQLEVIKKPKVIYIPTGDELVYPGEVPYRGQTIESNSIMVKGMINEFGADVYCFPIIRDDKQALETALNQALMHGDIVLVNGGSSKGSEDFNSMLIEEKATFFRHGIRAVPGRPVGISVIDNIPVINMPGPAIASFIALDWCVRGLIAHYYNTKCEVRPTIKVKLAKPIKKRKEFEMYQRFELVKENGEYIAYPLTRDKSLPYIAYNTKAMFIAPIGVEEYPAGAEVEMELMCGNECL